MFAPDLIQTPLTPLPEPASKLKTNGVVLPLSTGSTVTSVLLQVASEPLPSASATGLMLKTANARSKIATKEGRINLICLMPIYFLFLLID